MDRFEAMKIFIRVAELQSFTKAAESLDLPKASVSNYIQNLEKLINARLLNRTTRHVELTPEGNSFYERCKDILSDIDETESMFSNDTNIKGKIRIDMIAGLATNFIIPLIPQFMEAHPDIEIELSSSDRKVDLIREGIDCVIRAGKTFDPGLVEKHLGKMMMMNCVSPKYVAKYGTPKNLKDLKNHKLIYYTPILGAKPDGFEYFDGNKYVDIKMPGSFTVNNTDAYMAACLAGLGIIQIPTVRTKKYFQDGNLIEVLPEFTAQPMDFKLVYPYRRTIAKRVRVFIDWLEPVVKSYIE